MKPVKTSKERKQYEKPEATFFNLEFPHNNHGLCGHIGGCPSAGS